MKAAKQYARAILLTGAFAALILFTTKERASNTNAGVTVSDSSFREDILSSYAIEMNEIHGIRVDNHEADSVSYYFEYEADYQAVLGAIAAQPARIDDNRYSIQCGLMNSNANPLVASGRISKEELNASEFFWKVKPENYTFYECLRGSMKHTLLVSKSSSRILHRIEVV